MEKELLSEKIFCQDLYYGYLIRADLIGAIGYVKQFPNQAELYKKFIAILEQEEYITYEVDAYLNEILTIYQRYYRNAFYLRIIKENAVDKLRADLAAFFGIDDGVGLTISPLGRLVPVAGQTVTGLLTA